MLVFARSEAGYVLQCETKPKSSRGGNSMSATLKKTNSFALSLLVLAVLLFGIVPSAMADVYGVILGTVTDPSGAVVPGAKVVLRNTGTGLARTAATNASGYYEFLAVPVGENYSVEVDAQ